MVLASAIKQVRGQGDNKFEVVTSLRTFIFRAEREGTASAFCSHLSASHFGSFCPSAGFCGSDHLIPRLALLCSHSSPLIPLRPPSVFVSFALIPLVLTFSKGFRWQSSVSPPPCSLSGFLHMYSFNSVLAVILCHCGFYVSHDSMCSMVICDLVNLPCTA